MFLPEILSPLALGVELLLMSVGQFLELLRNVGTMVHADAAFDGTEVIPTTISISSDCCVMRGDINHDGQIDISDIIDLGLYMFNFGPLPPCPEEANVNGDNLGVDISDLVHRVYYMFGGGPAPAPCN